MVTKRMYGDKMMIYKDKMMYGDKKNRTRFRFSPERKNNTLDKRLLE